MPIEKNVTIDDLPDGDVSVEMDDEPSSSIDIVSRRVNDRMRLKTPSLVD